MEQSNIEDILRDHLNQSARYAIGLADTAMHDVELIMSGVNQVVIEDYDIQA